MNSGDPRIQAALDAAQKPIREAAATAADEALANLKVLVRAASQRDRSALALAQSQLQQSRQALLAAFEKTLRETVNEEVAPKNDEPGFRDPTDWMAIGLVGEDQIEDKLACERVAQAIGHECDAEVRDLSAFTGELLEHGWADPTRNPLRGAIIASALSQAVEVITKDGETQRVLVKEVGQALAKALPDVYRSVIADFTKRGMRQIDPSVRPAISQAGGGPGGAGAAGGAGGAAGAGTATSPPGLEAMRELWEKSMVGRMPMGADAARAWEASMSARGGYPGAVSAGMMPAGMTSAGMAPTDMASANALFERLLQGSAMAAGMPAGPGGTPWNGPAGAPGAPSYGVPSDADLMRLLRRLNGGGPESAPAASSGGAGAPAAGSPRGDVRWSGGDGYTPGGDAAPSLFGGLMATNMIRAHQDELAQASSGQLDHMVIEVVASLFDQILADSRVAPQIAREIARLQLPVLRVALRDTSFFSSRKHPVRRFINRISSLAASFGELDSGPGKELLARAHGLVTEIVEGDFDQIPLYTKKLLELESFIADLARAEAENSPAAKALEEKEGEWRLAQRFAGQLQEALEPLPLAPHLKDFLTQVWSQAIVAASQGENADPAREKRFRQATYDLVASVQPKRSVEQRAQFISALPGLTATLNEGLGLIAWPKEAHNAFFGKLMADHAGSLKAAPGSDLDHNMLLRRIEVAARTPLPSAGDGAGSDATPAEAFEPRFSPREAERLGLIDDAAVDWSAAPAPTSEGSRPGPLDGAANDIDEAGGELDLDLATRPAPIDMPSVAAAQTSAFPTIVPPAAAAGISDLPALSMPAPVPVAKAADPEEPTEGPQLRHHLQIGLSYQLRLKDEWEKVRLTFMSPQRTLFLFAHGSKDRGTISMTARMLERLCETQRLKAFEASPLLDRATERLRTQLATPAPAAAAAPREMSEA